jgi:hypothetical protein
MFPDAPATLIRVRSAAHLFSYRKHYIAIFVLLHAGATEKIRLSVPIAALGAAENPTAVVHSHRQR